MGDQTAAAAEWPFEAAVADGKPVLPDYSGACNANIVDVLINDPDSAPDWFPPGLQGHGGAYDNCNCSDIDHNGTSAGGAWSDRVPDERGA